MSWADLDKVQVGKPRADGSGMVVIRDERTTSAILETRPLSTLIATSRVIRSRAAIARLHDGRGTIVYHCSEIPPSFLVDAVSAAGGVVFAAGREHVNRTALATTVQLDGAFVDLATSVRRRFKVSNAGDALDVLEHQLRRRPIGKDDVVAWWTAMVELAALAGELVRADRPARWIEAPDQRLPLGLDLGAAGTIVPGAMAQTLLEGGVGSMRSLVQLTQAAAWVATGAAGRSLPMLCNRHATPLDRIHWSPLLTEQVDSPDVPVIAWVEDHDSAIHWPRGSGEPPPELRIRALANLGQIEVELAPMKMPFGTMAVVSGDFFAAEMLLHPPTMRRIAAAIGGTQTMLVGTPARGYLFAVDALIAELDDDFLQAFLLTIEGAYQEATECDRISTEAIVCFDNRPLGRVHSSVMDARRALRKAGVDPDAAEPDN
ncbi:MAG: hypothetical protein H0T42_10690 [Deltaproteobacteria bacterium]|nr:hypothetical protein [Deltaproteobacteria bacterium]